MKRLALAAAAALLSAAAAHGAPGARPFRFLSSEFNARALALGGAYSALAIDAAAVHYNPAGLASLERSEASFMHNALAEGASQEQLGVALPQGWGLGLNYLDSGPVMRTTISRPDGTQGETRSADIALAGAFGRRFGALSAGAALKLIRGSVAEQSAYGAALDLGLMWHASGVRGLTLALAAQNLGPDVKFEEQSEALPASVRVGAGWGFLLRGQRATLALDLQKGLDGGPLPAAGGELVIARVMPVRLGVSQREDGDAQFSAGVGWLFGSASFDYGVVPFSGLGMEHRFSVAARWGQGRDDARREREDERAAAKVPSSRPKQR